MGHESRQAGWATVAWAAGSYLAVTIIGLSLFTVILGVMEGFGDAAVGFLAGAWLATLFGTLVGQALAVMQFRGVVVLSTTGWLVAGTWLALAQIGGGADQLERGGIALAVALLLAPAFVWCGAASLDPNTGALPAVAPMAWFVGAIFELGEKTRAVDRWIAGDKWAIWDALTAPLLGLAVVLVLGWLALRERFRLWRWRWATDGPAPPGERAARPIDAGGRGCGAVLAIAVLGTVLTIATAFVAPYLFRSGPGDRSGDGGRDVAMVQPAEGGHRDETAWERGDPRRGRGVDDESRLDQAQRAARHATMSLLLMMAMVLLALLTVVVFGPPLWRMFLLRHLRQPLWPVPPTRRVHHAWRMVEIALSDSGIHRRPGETATALAERAIRHRVVVDPGGLRRCAEIADRATWGLGLAPDDTMIARRAAEMTYQEVWEGLDEGERLRAMYRTP